MLSIFYPFQHPGPTEEGNKWLCGFTQKHVYAFVVWYTWMRPCLTVVHPDTVKEVLRTTEPKPVSQFGVYRLLLPWIGMFILKYLCIYGLYEC